MSAFLEKNKTVLLVLIPLLVSFLICHGIFSYYDNLASDDYNIIGNINDKGIFGTLIFMYTNWEGAFGGVIMNTIILKLCSYSESSFIHHLASFIIITLCFYVFIKNAAKKYFSIDLLPSAIMLMTISFITEMYYTDLAIYDTWYWVCGNIYVLMPALFLGVLAIHFKYNNGASLALLFFYCILFGSSRFNYAIIAIVFNCLLLIGNYWRNKTISKALLTCLILLTLSLVIYIIAPGNYIRRNEELQRHPAMLEYITGPFKMSLSYIVKYIIAKIPYHLIYLVPAVWALFYNSNLSEKKWFQQLTSIKTFLILTAITLAFIYLQSFSMFLAKGSQTPRTFVMLNFLVSVYLFYALVVAFFRFQTKKVFYGFTLVCALAASFLLLRRLQLNYEGIKLYSEKLIQRNITIKEAIVRSRTEKIDTLKLELLPPSGYLHNTELNKRSGDNPMNNIFLENYYKPNFVLDIKD